MIVTCSQDVRGLWNGDIVVSGLSSCVGGKAPHQTGSLERSRCESRRLSSVLLIRHGKCTLEGAMCEFKAELEGWSQIPI